MKAPRPSENPGESTAQTAEMEATDIHSEVPPATLEQQVAEATAVWRSWREIDHVEMYSADFASRQMASWTSQEDGRRCAAAAEQITDDPKKKEQLRLAARELQMNALFLVPEEATQEKVDLALDLSIEMARGWQGKEWRAADLAEHMKFYDLQHLAAYWEAKLADETDDESRRTLAKVILGGSIADAADDLQHLMTTIENIDLVKNPDDKGLKSKLVGVLGEFTLVTVMRLKTLFDDQAGELFIRSALSMEDSLNDAPRSLSADILSHAPNPDSIKFIQCKTTPTTRAYDPAIEVVIVDGREIRANAPWVRDLLAEFTDATDFKLQEEVMNELSRLVGLGRKTRNYEVPTIEDLTQYHLAGKDS